RDIGRRRVQQRESATAIDGDGMEVEVECGAERDAIDRRLYCIEQLPRAEVVDGRPQGIEMLILGTAAEECQEVFTWGATGHRSADVRAREAADDRRQVDDGGVQLCAE